MLLFIYLYSMKRTLKKLGEGVFGEVFSCYTPEGEGLAVKVSTYCPLLTQV